MKSIFKYFLPPLYSVLLIIHITPLSNQLLTMFPSSKALYLLLFCIYMVVQDCKSDQVQGYSRATNCNQADCATYTVTYSEKEFEIRIYNKAMWIATSPFTVDSVMFAYGFGTVG